MKIRVLGSLLLLMIGVVWFASPTNSRFADSTANGTNSFTAGTWATGIPSTGLLWQLDASDSSTLFADTGCSIPIVDDITPVKCWDDVRDGFSGLLTVNLSGPSRVSTEFNGHPGVRFKTTEGLIGENRFSSATTSDMQIVAVSKEVVAGNNYAVSLNGEVRDIPNRFSFHLPWGNRYVYFDAGGCCVDNRVRSEYGAVTIGVPFIVSASKQGTSNQLQINNGPVNSNDTGTPGTVAGGLRLGDMAGSTTNSFAEVLVWDRRLTPAELAEVKAYLIDKWGL